MQRNLEEDAKNAQKLTETVSSSQKKLKLINRTSKNKRLAINSAED